MGDLENVQRRATKIVPSLKDKPYYDRLVSLNLPSLLYRRKRMDVIMVYLDWRVFRLTDCSLTVTYWQD